MNVNIIAALYQIIFNIFMPTWGNCFGWIYFDSLQSLKRDNVTTLTLKVFQISNLEFPGMVLSNL